MAARIVDKGWMKIQSDIKALQGRGVKVGLLSGGPSQDGVPVVEYATMNEFGTSEIPSRPFMRTTADNAEGPFKQFSMQIARGVYTRGAGGRFAKGNLGVSGVLDAVGLWYQAKIRATIRSSPSWAVANSPMTIQAKGSSTPLIDHGVMIGAIDYERTRL